MMVKYPVLATRIIHARIESVLNEVYFGDAQPHGEKSDHYAHIEFQLKGANRFFPAAH